MTNGNHFQSLHNSLLRMLRQIRKEEIRLGKKTNRTSAENAKLKELKKARFDVADQIIRLSDAQDVYLRSPAAAAVVLQKVQEAKTTAYNATRNLQSAEEALQKLSTIVQIVTGIAKLFGV